MLCFVSKVCLTDYEYVQIWLGTVRTDRLRQPKNAHFSWAGCQILTTIITNNNPVPSTKMVVKLHLQYIILQTQYIIMLVYTSTTIAPLGFKSNPETIKSRSRFDMYPVQVMPSWFQSGTGWNRKHKSYSRLFRGTTHFLYLLVTHSRRWIIRKQVGKCINWVHTI